MGFTDWLDRYQAHHFVSATNSGARPSRRARVANWIVLCTPTAQRNMSESCDRWRSLAGDLWGQLDGVEDDQRTPIMQMYIDEYERRVGIS